MYEAPPEKPVSVDGRASGIKTAAIVAFLVAFGLALSPSTSYALTTAALALDVLGLALTWLTADAAARSMKYPETSGLRSRMCAVGSAAIVFALFVGFIGYTSTPLHASQLDFRPMPTYLGPTLTPPPSLQPSEAALPADPPVNRTSVPSTPARPTPTHHIKKDSHGGQLPGKLLEQQPVHTADPPKPPASSTSSPDPTTNEGTAAPPK